MKRTYISRLVKSEDLNHHGTLFAGRLSEWFVENCFICGATETGRPENIVCVNIHGLSIKSPVKKGSIVKMESYIAKAGRSSFTVYGKVQANDNENVVCEGFISFVFVDENGKSMAHGITLDETTDEMELIKRELALSL